MTLTRYVSRVELTDRTHIRDDFTQRYGAQVKGVLIDLLKKINRNDLVETVNTVQSLQEKYVDLSGWRKAINIHKVAVMEELAGVISDLPVDGLERFLWTLKLSSNPDPTLSNILKMLCEHVKDDTTAMCEAVYNTLVSMNYNDLAAKLKAFILGLSA